MFFVLPISVSLFRGVVCAVFFYYENAKGLWCACIDRGLKMDPPPPPISARLAIHPSIRGRGVWGSEEDEEEEGGRLMRKRYYFQIDLNMSDIRKTITGDSGSS